MPASSWFSRIRLAHYAPDGVMSAHRHEYASLCLVVHGGYEESIRGRRDWHRPGEMMFCPADETHAQTFAGEGALKILFELRESTLDYLRDHLPLAEAPFTGSARLAAMARRIHAELAAETNDATSRLAVEGLALETLAEFGRHAVAPAPTEPWLRQALEYVHAHACNGFLLEELAQAVGRHPVHVARSFRAAFGMRVGDLTRELRLTEAARRLRATDEPISQVAATCGFSDQAHLTRHFHAAYGTTPARYRRRWR